MRECQYGFLAISCHYWNHINQREISCILNLKEYIILYNSNTNKKWHTDHTTINKFLFFFAKVSNCDSPQTKTQLQNSDTSKHDRCTLQLSNNSDDIWTTHKQITTLV